jgi:hypothetical protein
MRARLLEVFFFQVWEVFEQLLPMRIRRQDLEYAPDGDPHSADASRTAHLSRLDCDSIENSIPRCDEDRLTSSWRENGIH